MADPEKLQLVPVSLQLHPVQALALAELCKRIGFSDCRSNAVDDSEAYHMIYAMANVRKALERSGVYVR